jgi:hypothetical protein
LELSDALTQSINRTDACILNDIFKKICCKYWVHNVTNFFRRHTIPLLEQTHFLCYACLLMRLRIISTQSVAAISVCIAITGGTCANNWYRETVKYLINENDSSLTLIDIKSCTNTWGWVISCRDQRIISRVYIRNKNFVARIFQKQNVEIDSAASSGVYEIC